MCDSNYFDDLVVGSSPLMLMQAQRLAKAGRKVQVIDRSSRYGGSWSVAEIEADTGLEAPFASSGALTEIACHVIEVFPHVYKILESSSGVPFVPLNVQPIRLSRHGLRLRYFSRLLLVVSGMRLFFGWAKARVQLRLGNKGVSESSLNYDSKLASYLRYQLPTFFGDTRLYGPRDGYVDFLARLEQRCRADGVAFCVGEVSEMKRIEGEWLLSLKGGTSVIKARRVHLTTSTNLRPAGLDRFIAVLPRYALRTAWVVAVPAENISIRHSYIAFWRDPVIARISRIDAPIDRPIGPDGYVYYLLEKRPIQPGAPNNEPAIATIRKAMERAGIIQSGGQMYIAGRVTCEHVYNMDQLPEGHIAPNVWGYFSYGNLAAGIAAWMDQDTVPE